jgi:hypothetical protein
MTDCENSRIREACNLVMAYHYGLASARFLETDDISKKNKIKEIMDNSCSDSFLSLLIKENKWDELFKNEKWLNFLQGAQNFSVFEKRLNIPLLFLSKLFPTETEYYIIPELIKG